MAPLETGQKLNKTPRTFIRSFFPNEQQSFVDLYIAQSNKTGGMFSECFQIMILFFMSTRNSCGLFFKCCLSSPVIELLKVTRATWSLWLQFGLSPETMSGKQGKPESPVLKWTRKVKARISTTLFSRQQALLVLSKRKRRTVFF